MQAFLDTIAAQAGAFSGLEVVAVIAAVLYLLLAIRQNIWCWLFAGISTAIYVYLFIHARLYMESALNVFYFAMAIYGFSVWYRGRTPGAELPVTEWPTSVELDPDQQLLFFDRGIVELPPGSVGGGGEEPPILADQHRVDEDLRRIVDRLRRDVTPPATSAAIS